jgi:hypothetical protein
MARKAKAAKLFGHVLPAALPDPCTGNNEVDTLVATRRRERWTPAGQAAFARLHLGPKPSDAAALVALLSQPEAYDFGVIPPWEDDYDRAPAAERKERQKALDLVYGARTEREQYFTWLVLWGENHLAARARLRELLADDAVNERAKAIIATQLLAEKKAHRPEDVAAVAGLWERGVKDLALVPIVLMAAVEQDLPGSYRRFGPLLDAKPDTSQIYIASALLGGLRPLASQLPPEWGARLARALGQEVLAIFVPPVLAGMPRDPSYLPPLLKLMQGFVTPEGLTCIARHGDHRATPLLIQKLARDTPHWDKLLEACRAVGDPALVPALKQWTEKQRTVGANGEWIGFVEVERVIAELRRKAEATRITGKNLAYVPSRTPRTAAPRGRAPALKHRKHPAHKQQRAELVGLLKEHELAAKADVLIRDGWVMRATRVEETALPLGGTRLGGLPDLPAGVGWPAIGDRSLSFAAQVRLSEVSAHGLLPKSGLLSFFVLDEWADQETPGYLEKAVVLFTPELTALHRLPIPKNFQSRRDGTMEERQPFAACLVEWVRVAKLPAPSNQQVKKALTPAELKRYEKIALDVLAENQLLGWRDRTYDGEQPPDVELLLQLTSDEPAGMEWGDSDALDFYSPRAALLKGDFSKVFPYCGD